MNTVVTATRMLIRLDGLALLVLGVLIWTGTAAGLVGIHIMLGFLLVLLMWTLAGLGAWAGVGTGQVLVLAVWALVMPAFGLVQRTLHPGPGHWVIAVVHLLIGLAALGLAEGLGARTRRRVLPGSAGP